MSQLTEAEIAALAVADEIARAAGVPRGPNPRVGCVILSSSGRTIATGFHRGAGTPHAEVAALAAAGAQARAATAVVTLEPCDHTGRTGPCSQALIDAGIARVVFAVADPGGDSGGGAKRLREAGIEVIHAADDAGAQVPVADIESFLRPWLIATQRGRPFVTLKTAATLDGRVAAADGTSRWITGPSARADVHRLRGEVDAVIVGTGTAIVDNPSLTVRDAQGARHGVQPLRVVVGSRDLPASSRLAAPAEGEGGVVHLRTHDAPLVLAELFNLGVRHALIEGGPTLAAAFIRAGMVDQWISFIAPIALGAGPSAVGDLGVSTITAASAWEVREVVQLDTDVKITTVPKETTD